MALKLGIIKTLVVRTWQLQLNKCSCTYADKTGKGVCLFNVLNTFKDTTFQNVFFYFANTVPSYIFFLNSIRAFSLKRCTIQLSY